MISLTASQVIEYIFCPRFTYYEEVLGIPQHEELRHKVLVGRKLHERRSVENREYLRKRLGALDKKINVYLGGEGLPFRGEVDEVLIFEGNRMAPLDYKFAEYREKLYKTYRTQASIYAYLIRAIFGAQVDRAYLVFIRSNNYLLEVPITTDDFLRLERLYSDILGVLQGESYPQATKNKARCVDCCYRNICPR